MPSNKNLPSEVETIIIGGGIIGCSVAYHLSKRGMRDIVVLERKQLTCGTTWHAAGLVSMLWPTPTLTNLAKYCHELYASLESETGQATGYRRIGSVSLARNNDSLEELDRYEARCRLSSSIIPEAMALIVNKSSPQMLISLVEEIMLISALQLLNNDSITFPSCACLEI